MPAKAPVYKAPAPVIFNWTGFYIGGHAGAAWSSGDAEWDPLPSPLAFDVNTIIQSLKDTSFIGGIHLGYNYMFAPNWLVGIAQPVLIAWSENAAT